MVARKLSSYMNEEDTNNQKIGEWAEDLGNSKARCKYCNDGHVIDFQKGKDPLKTHSQSQKHRNASKKVNLHFRQANLNESINVDRAAQTLAKQVKRFEIDLTRRLDAHNISKSFISCITDCIKTHLTCENAAKVVKEVKLSKSKAVYLSKFGIGKTYFQQTVELVKTCDAFSIGFD